MMIGEVCLLTNDVRKLADFYKKLLEIDNNSNDETQSNITGVSWPRDRKTTGDIAQKRNHSKRCNPILRNKPFKSLFLEDRFGKRV